MSVKPEQVLATAKSNLEAGIKSSVAAVSAVFAGVEKLTTLNLNTARTALEDGAALLKALGEVKDPKALVALQVSLLKPTVDKSIAYGRAVADIGSTVKAELTAQCEAEAAKLVGQYNDALESLFKSAPAGSEAAVSAVKGMLAQANATCAEAAQKVKAAVAQAEAQLSGATAAAVENVTKATVAAEKALKTAA